MEEGESGLILKPSCLHIAKAWFLPACEPLEAVDQNDLFLTRRDDRGETLINQYSPVAKNIRVFDLRACRTVV
jgi:hypothetical protein